jgi:hypothetical protein
MMLGTSSVCHASSTAHSSAPVQLRVRRRRTCARVSAEAPEWQLARGATHFAVQVQNQFLHSAFTTHARLVCAASG